MIIGIVGYGIVGRTLDKCFKTLGHETQIYDIQFSSKIDSVLETDCIFVCVSTPTVDGNFDSSNIDDVITKLAAHNYRGLIVIKSTVIPGTAERLSRNNLRIASNPEFLREEHAFKDIMNQDVLVIGCNNNDDADLIKAAFEGTYESAVVMSPTETEIFKYFSNVHNAMEIVFANSMYEVCSKLNQNYDNLLKAAEKRKTLNTSYLNCSPNKRAFSGNCLPKDVEAWSTFTDKLNINVKLFSSIIHDNETFK